MGSGVYTLFAVLCTRVFNIQYFDRVVLCLFSYRYVLSSDVSNEIKSRKRDFSVAAGIWINSS